MGCLWKLHRTKPQDDEHFVPHYHCHARYSILWSWLRKYCDRFDCTRCFGGLPVRQTRCQVANQCPHLEHSPALHDDDYGRLFFVCPYRHPFCSQYTNGPELTGRHLYVGWIPRSWAIWYPSFILRADLRFQTCFERSGWRLCIRCSGRCSGISTQGKGFCRWKGQLRSGSLQDWIQVCTEHVFPAYVQWTAYPGLRRLVGRCRRTHCSLRPMWRNADGEDSYPMGKHQVLLLLSGEFHVLEILHVELCRSSEWYPRQWWNRTW